MVVAALVSFGVLLLAWIAAPAEGTREVPGPAVEPATGLETSPQGA